MRYIVWVWALFGFAALLPFCLVFRLVFHTFLGRAALPHACFTLATRVPRLLPQDVLAPGPGG